MPARDMFGRPIGEGDYLVYPATISRSGTLMFARVLEIRQGETHASRADDAISLRVQAALQLWGRIESRSKASILLFPQRACILPEAAVPHTAREAIRAVPRS